MLKALVIAPKLEKTFEHSQYLNQGLTIKDAVKSAPFESYMDKLTLFTSIRGPSIDDVKAKAS